MVDMGDDGEVADVLDGGGGHGRGIALAGWCGKRSRAFDGLGPSGSCRPVPAAKVSCNNGFPTRPLRLGFEHWLNALLDSRRQERAVIATLAAYAAIWTAYRAIATSPRDIHADVAELYGWSHELAFGYDKHPPFSAVVAKAWLLLFPVNDLSLDLLATANIAVTLYIAWRTMRRYLSPEKTVFGLALLMLVPFFNFIALKYNANAVLLPLCAHHRCLPARL
jgi:hypothetical protein